MVGPYDALIETRTSWVSLPQPLFAPLSIPQRSPRRSNISTSWSRPNHIACKDFRAASTAIRPPTSLPRSIG
ncbi:hypothetical protein KTR9_4129 [Gordonia sp. KTR9]|nr:hypothetical protein KTR9_4129 [Gordonia sp. KTR9]